MLYKEARCRKLDRHIDVSNIEALIRGNPGLAQMEIVLESQLLHTFSKGFCCHNESTGYTEEGGTHMLMYGGALKLSRLKVEYLVEARDNDYGVDSTITKIVREDEEE